MSTDSTELTFVRCPACRSLVPAVSTRCRMCGAGLDASAKPEQFSEPKAGRVRQRTMSQPGNELSVTAGAVRRELGEPVTDDAPADSTVVDSDDPLSSYLHEVPADEAAPEVPPAKASQPAPATPVREAAAPDPVVAKGSDIVEEDEVAEELHEEAESQAPAEAEAAPAPIFSDDSDDDDEDRDQQSDVIASSNDQWDTEMEEPIIDEPAPPARSAPAAEAPPRPRAAQPAAQAKKPEEAPAARRSSEPKAAPTPPEPTRERHQAAEPRAPKATERPAKAPVKAPAPRQAEAAPAAKREQERRAPSANEQPSRVEPAPQHSAELHEGRLVGWFVTYAEPDGLAHELREGKFFVTQRGIKERDFVINDDSISAPHAVMKIVGGSVSVQDLMSERGVFVRKRGSEHYQREEESVLLAHGDWVRFGDIEYLVCLVAHVGEV